MIVRPVDMPALRPVDVPVLRADAITEISTYGPEVYGYALREGCQIGAQFIRGGPTEQAAALTAAEVDRLTRAELFYVGAPMVDLVTVAAASLPEFTLMPEDLPAPAGLMVFAKSIAWATGELGMAEGMAAPITAVSWSLMSLYVLSVSAMRDFVWFTWYSDRDLFHADCLARGLLTDAAVRQRSADHPSRLTLDNETFVGCSETQLPATTSVGRQDDGRFGWVTRDMQEVRQNRADTLHFAEIAKTAFVLMDQPIAATADHDYTRTERKLVERRTGAEPPPVRVLTLRRPAHHSTGQSDREYHHQWIVRGHWRQQWYPSREVHRPVWIAPHVKGDPDKPMLGGEKVYAWTR